MHLIPALDIMRGRCVLLHEGRRMSAEVFHERAQEMVPYLTYGSDRLHVVDHDGAAGEPRQVDLLARIIRDSRIPVQVAGGIKDSATVDQMVAIGAAYVVLDSSLSKSPNVMEQVLRPHAKRLIVTIEARDSYVHVGGWSLPSGITASELGQLADSVACAGILYADYTKVGQTRTPNVTAAQTLAKSVKCEVIVSGGVGTLDDIARLRDAKIHACVVGRALYERRFSVLEAVRIAHG